MSAVVEHTPVHAHALRFAALGVPTFPVHRTLKQPSIRGWQFLASCDPTTIGEWFGEGGAYGLSRLGIKTGVERCDPATGATQWLTVIDLDVKPAEDGKPAKDGPKSLADACVASGFDLRTVKTLVVRTASGGTHLYFWCGSRLKNLAGVLGKTSGVDIRADGGLVVGPGGTGKAGEYRIVIDEPIATMPDALAALFPLDTNDTRAADTTPIPGVDPAHARALATAYLKNEAPLAIQDESGDDTTYQVACRVKDFGCTEAETLDVMLEHWDPRCDPPWGDELATKVANAYRHGKQPPGIGNAKAVFAAAPIAAAPADEDATPHPLARLNAEYAFVLIGGTAYILWETVDEHGKPRTEFLTPQAFKGMHAASKFNGKPIADAWLEWKDRRTFHKLAFAPGRTLAPQFYNMWRGFAVEPRRGTWSRMRAHIRDVICSGDKVLDDYVMGWLARAVQLPGERGEVALVLKGGKGTGKGTLGHAVRRIFGRHGVHIANAKHLVGNFNGHIREAAFLFADEAFFAGDKQHEGVLKTLITEPTLMIEAKGKDAEPRDNCLHVLMASNEEWVVPASADERRFAVIEVSAAHQQDEAYFDAIARELDAGGLEAMLFDLLAQPLAGFSVRRVPQTKALGEQKLTGLRGPARWIYDALGEGAVDHMQLRATWGAKEIMVSKADAYRNYCEKSRQYGEHHPVPDKVFWKVIRQALDGLRETRTGAPRIRYAIFPALEAARSAFEKHMRTPIVWDAEDDEDIFS